MSDLQQQYSLSDISMLTNISLRSLRNYVRMGYISGDMLDRKRVFTFQQVVELFKDPFISEVIRKRARSVLNYEFLNSKTEEITQLVAFQIPECNDILLHEIIDTALVAEKELSVKVCFSFTDKGLRVFCFGNSRNVIKATETFRDKPHLRPILEKMREE